ncbi:MAG: adenylyltransferase/cytidyltransferase family protein [Silvanigrellaceae bacterium]|nr:adenylyltransferase/cytidyltransferase family protein [Silvanigrellaceae bacterium]
MKSAIYVGSFDPWTFGHKFVLDAALKVFDCIHVVTAVNPIKQGLLTPELRSRIIAHSIDPLTNWWHFSPPFHAGPAVIVASHEGLTAEYAFDNGIIHLIRGLRSTSDFEAEFNLYFSNTAINSELQTWAIMCPPDLLYCSSTYVKSVVGKESVRFVGTSFVSQAYLLNSSKVIGRLFDLIELCFAQSSQRGFEGLSKKEVNAALQQLYIYVLGNRKHFPEKLESEISDLLEDFLKTKAKYIRKGLENHSNLDDFCYTFVAFVINYLVKLGVLPEEQSLAIKEFCKLNVKIGKANVVLFNENLLVEIYNKIYT